MKIKRIKRNLKMLVLLSKLRNLRILMSRK